MTALDGPRVAPRSGGAPRQLVVLCHGHGASGQDMLHLVDHWGPALPDALFVAPDGPEGVLNNPAGRRWFDLSDRSPAVVDRRVRPARVVLDAFIDAELAAAGLPADAYALFGMSQGAMTVLFTGLRRQTAPRGILAYSGALAGAHTLKREITHRPPVLLVHGDQDQAVPIDLARLSEQMLRASGVPVETFFGNFGHWITPEGVAAGTNFLQRIFA